MGEVNHLEVGQLGLDTIDESLEVAAQAIAQAVEAYWDAPLILDEEARKLERALALVREVVDGE